MDKVTPAHERELVQKYQALAAQLAAGQLPSIRFTSGKGSRYRPAEREVVIGLRDFHGTENALDHELAHFVDYMRRPDPPRLLGQTRRQARFSRHDRVFYRTLVEIVKARGADPKVHDWHREYGAIHAMAKADRLTDQTWALKSRRQPENYSAHPTSPYTGYRVGQTVEAQITRGRRAGLVIRGTISKLGRTSALVERTNRMPGDPSMWRISYNVLYVPAQRDALRERAIDARSDRREV